MASEDVTCGERMGGESERLTSAVESCSICGRVEATEEVVFPERKWYIFSTVTWSDLCDLTMQW